MAQLHPHSHSIRFSRCFPLTFFPLIPILCVCALNGPGYETSIYIFTVIVLKLSHVEKQRYVPMRSVDCGIVEIYIDPQLTMVVFWLGTCALPTWIRRLITVLPIKSCSKILQQKYQGLYTYKTNHFQFHVSINNIVCAMMIVCLDHVKGDCRYEESYYHRHSSAYI